MKQTKSFQLLSEPSTYAKAAESPIFVSHFVQRQIPNPYRRFPTLCVHSPAESLSLMGAKLAKPNQPSKSTNPLTLLGGG